MKKQILFKSALSLVAAAAAGSAFAAVTATNVWENFEDYSVDFAITNAVNGLWSASAEGDDQSTVVAGNGGQVLELKTEGATLTRALENTAAANTAIANGELVVFESEIKFVPSDSDNCGLAGGEDDTKFAIFAYAPDGGPTNLVIFHAYVDGDTKYTNEVIDVHGALDNPDAFTKITVTVTNVAIASALYFSVDLGEGESVQHLRTSIEDDYNDPELEDLALPMTLFKTVNASASTSLSAICFKGTGAVDNLLVKTGEDEASSGTVAEDAEGNTFTVPDTAVATFAAAGVSDVTNQVPGKSITYAQAYALGTYTIDNNVVTVTEPEATIEFDETTGEPKVTLTGTNPDTANYTVTCKLYGSTSLPVDTTGTPIATGAPGTALVDDGASSDATKFYKVVITIVNNNN